MRTRRRDTVFNRSRVSKVRATGFGLHRGSEEKPEVTERRYKLDQNFNLFFNQFTFMQNFYKLYKFIFLVVFFKFSKTKLTIKID